MSSVLRWVDLMRTVRSTLLGQSSFRRVFEMLQFPLAELLV